MDTRRVQVRPVIFCLLIVLLAFGCGGDGGDTPSPSQNTNALASARIRAADGGTVTVPSPHPLAGTSIAIPPGALDSDTIISIFAAPLPGLPGVMGLAIDLQPDGTAFRVPVTVTLVYHDADLPAGTREERLSIAKVDANGTLVPLTNVRVDTAANMVRGETTSLSVYVLVLPSNTAPNTAPVANAGPDQTVVVGHTVTLDGSHSTDVDGDPLQYQWTLVGRPSGSQAALADPTLVLPTFIVDRPGSYTVRLVVNDGKVNSTPDTVTITTTNTFPVANAGPDQTVFVRTTVHLDGSMSSDVDGDALQFAWSLTISPSGSSATLSDPTVVNPTFVANKPGA